MITVVHSADDQIKEIQKLGKTLTMPQEEAGSSRILFWKPENVICTGEQIWIKR